MELNDSYSQARSQILMMKPLPTVNQAYDMLMSDESQRVVVVSAGVLGSSPTVTTNAYDSTALYSAKPNFNQKYRKNYNVQCEFCKMKGHNKKNCYKIIRDKETLAPRLKHVLPPNSLTDQQVLFDKECPFTKEQYDQIMLILNNSPTPPTQENATDATNHIVSDVNLLSKTSLITPFKPRRVLLPNGDVTQVTHIGDSHISDKNTIKEVLYDLFNGKVKEIGHVSSMILKKLFPSKLASITDTINKYNVCPCTKQTRLPFPTSCIKSTDAFDLIHVDVWGPYKYATFDSNKYVLTIIDDFTRMTWLFLLKLKSDVCVVLAQFIVFVQTQFHKTMKAIRTDNGYEFVNSFYNTFYKNMALSIRRPVLILLSKMELLRENTGTYWRSSTYDEEHTSFHPPAFTHVNYIHIASNSRLSLKHQAYLAIFSTIMEPTSFEDVGKDFRWVDAMQDETATLESNHTCDVSKHDHSLFVNGTCKSTIIILVYVDDMLLTGSNLTLICDVKAKLHLAFKMKELGDLKYFLGIEFARS
ncbi:uncharacterized protein LOC142168889 [Nicotiana tabacum]|uniref:Uncharacterized protein LOC142168889 n=1 Tax=Nicotiana tabacum TaxID=4097 RepID=A0AC58SME9_TOBAC